MDSSRTAKNLTKHLQVLLMCIDYSNLIHNDISNTSNINNISNNSSDLASDMLNSLNLDENNKLLLALVIIAIIIALINCFV